jgi:hypothetical protein
MCERKKNIPECMPYVFVFYKVKHVFLLYTKKEKVKKKILVNNSIFFYIRVPYLEVYLNYAGAVKILKNILQTS